MKTSACVLAGWLLLPVLLCLRPAPATGSDAPNKAPEDPSDKQPAADFRDPKKTFETYLKAIKANDLATAKKCWTIGEDKNWSAVLDIADGMWVTFHRLNQVILAKFGQKGWAVMYEWNSNVVRRDCLDTALDNTLARLKGAEVQIKGDKADLRIHWLESDPFETSVFHYSGEDPIAGFRKVDNHWMMDFQGLTGLMKPADFFQPGNWGVMWADTDSLIKKILADIERGQLHTAEEAITALEKGFEALELKSARDKTQVERTRARQRAKEQASNLPIPTATEVESGKSNWTYDPKSTPTIAVADSGDLYVLLWGDWRGDKAAHRAVPPIPVDLAFHRAGKVPDEVLGIITRRGGKWSGPAVLLDERSQGWERFAWCEGEKLNLLLADSTARKTKHLVYDPDTKRWTKRAELVLGERSAFSRVDSAVHMAEERDGLIYYSYFDGQIWSQPVRIEESRHLLSKNPYRGMRVTADRKGIAHLIWWFGNDRPRMYFYAVIRNGKASVEPLRFSQAPLDEHEDDVLDLNVDPQGRAILAYKPNLPKKHPDALKVHLRRRNKSGWSEPEKIGGEGEILAGSISILSNGSQMFVTWRAWEHHPSGAGLSFRRFAIHDGKAWTPSRWIARRPSLRGKALPLGAEFVDFCLDKRGNVHMLCEPDCYCLVAHLDAGPVRPTK